MTDSAIQMHAKHRFLLIMCLQDTEKFVPTETQRERERERESEREKDFVFKKCPAVCLQMTDSAIHLLVEHRFCHPDRCMQSTDSALQ
jgi:hypothetical protein